MLTINSMDNTKSIRIIDIQSREIDPYTVSDQYRGCLLYTSDAADE